MLAPFGHRREESDRPVSFLEEETANERSEARRQLLRWSLSFTLLFCGVFLAFWWSGSAVRFGAARVADRSVATYRISGIIRNAITRDPVAWASIDDDPSGRPPFYHADADQDGAYQILTLAEPHQLRIRAAGFKPLVVSVGRQWFLWWPRGAEQRDLDLFPE